MEDKITVKCPSCEVKVSVEVQGAKGDLVRKMTGNAIVKSLKQHHAEGKHGKPTN